MKEQNKGNKATQIVNPEHENFLVEFNLRNQSLNQMMVAVQAIIACGNTIITEKDPSVAHQQFAEIAKQVQEIAVAVAAANEHHKKSFHI
jgi:hypothetical protein